MRGDPCLDMAIGPQPLITGHNARMAKKRVYFMLDKIPPALWIRVKAKAKREGVSLRSLILGWCREWVDG
jgi:hypothetical protein